MDPQQQKKLQQNLKASQKANLASRYGKKGLSSAPSKMNSKSFQKLMSGRGISKSNTTQMWNSFSKKSPVMTRHAQKGEKFMMTYGKKPSKGVYVSKKSLGKNPTQRINKGALPPGNRATKQQAVRLGKNQNLVYGKIAAQKGFQKADPKGLPRKGGGMQTITNGGYRTGAVKNVMSKSAQSRLANVQKAKSFSLKMSPGKSSGKAPGKSMSGQKGHSR